MSLIKKSLLLPLLLVSFTFVSCDDDYWLEDKLVGEWYNFYEDRDVYEETMFNFAPNGMWTSSYRYEDVWGRYENTLDGGYYEVNYGRLYLYSEFYDDVRTFDVRFRRNRMYLSDGYVETEYIRNR